MSITSLDIPLRATDSHQWRLLARVPTQARTALLWLPALGVAAKHYLPFAEALAARGVPFVFATGYGEAGGAPLGFDAPVIRKPYDVTQVAAAVAGILAKT